MEKGLMYKELRILMLEDSPADAELEEYELKKSELVFNLKVVDTREAFLKELVEFSPDLILSDYDLPSFDGLEALRIAKEKCPDVPFILVTGKVGEEFAIEKLKEGATDYVLKGNLKRLVPVIKRALEEAEQIADRKQAEKEMLWKTALLESQLNATIDGILIVDEKGNKVIQNQRCIDLWKIPQHIVDNRDDKQQVEFVMNRAKDPQKFVEKVVYLYSHPNETSHEELEFKDGTILDRYSAPVIGQDGTYFGRIWIFRDVTEGKRAEKRIRESETIFQLLFDSMIEGMALHEIVYDDAGNAFDYRIIKVNPAYEKQTGISAKKAINSLGRELYGASTPPYMDIFTHVADTGESYSFETYFPPMQKHFKITVFSPKKGLFATVFEDITKRKQTEEERDRILNMSYDLICIAGTDGYFKYVNPAWEKTLGYSKEELLSKPFLDFIHPDDHQKNDEEVAKLSSGKQTYDFENRYIHKDGSIRIISWRATPLPEKGLMYCIGRDITKSR